MTPIPEGVSVLQNDPIAPALPPAGWYPNPENPAQERWWGGLSWTNDVRDPVPVMSAPPVPAPYTPMANAFVASQPQSFAAPGHWQVEVGSPNTVPIWLIATYPAVAVIIAVARLALPLDISRSLSFPIALIAFALYIGMAFWDHFELKRRGHDAASPAWVFLTVIAYLIARRIVLKKERRHP